jgi:hypothetical protein
MSRSSTSSSSEAPPRSLHLNAADPAWRAALQAVAVGVVVLALGEIASRVLLADVGRRWEYWHPYAATKFEFVRTAVERGDRLSALVVGDSTAAADVDPKVLDDALGPVSWNAGWSGNFPLAFEQTTLPLLADSRLRAQHVIALFIPSGFTASDELTPSEAGLVSSTFVQKRTTRQTGDYAYLARLKSAWPFLLARLRGRAEPEGLSRFGFVAQRGQATPDLIAREPVDDSDGSINPRRLAVLRQLHDATRRAGASLTVVIPPSLSQSPTRIATADRLKQALAGDVAAGLRVVDMMRPAFLTMNDFVDLNHLNAHGAEVFSRELARLLTDGR